MHAYAIRSLRLVSEVKQSIHRKMNGSMFMEKQKKLYIQDENAVTGTNPGKNDLKKEPY
jgi:hypothetical protein